MEENSEDEGATAPSLMFSCNAPIPVKNVLTRVSFEDDTRRTSNWLVEEHSEDEGATAASLMFSRNVPIPVKNVLTRVSFEDETRRTSNEPCFHIYSHSQQRMIADILMPSKGFDCRLSIRICESVNYDKKDVINSLSQLSVALTFYFMSFLTADGKLTANDIKKGRKKEKERNIG